jgi:hypothetical protein
MNGTLAKGYIPPQVSGGNFFQMIMPIGWGRIGSGFKSFMAAFGMTMLPLCLVIYLFLYLIS